MVATERLRTIPNEFRLSSKEVTPSHFFKYHLNLPLHPSPATIEKLKASGAEFPLDKVTLTLWSEQELRFDSLDYLRSHIDERNDIAYPVMLMDGLLSNSDQFDRTNMSFIRKLTDMVRSDPKHAGFNPLYIGMSGLGFTGSELNTDTYGPLDVGVQRYQTVMQTVMEELHYPKSHGAIIGHSAGGAVVLQHAHAASGDMLAKVSLCPAIHLDKASQFDYIDKLLALQEGLVPQALHGWSSEKVVRYLLGIPFLTPFDKLPIAVQEQILMHVAELDAHRYATHMKLKELNIPLSRGENSVLATLCLISENDILTPPSQIRKGFPADFKGFMTIPGGSHDDIFMKEDVQTQVIPIIASYIAKRQIDYALVKANGLK